MRFQLLRWKDGNTHSLSQRRERRGVGVRGALADPDDGGGAATALCLAGGVQWAVLPREDRRASGTGCRTICAALTGSLSADAALAGSGVLRSDHARPAQSPAAGPGAGAVAHGGDLRQPDAAIDRESGARAGDDGAKRRKGTKVHAAVDTLGYLLAPHVTPTQEQDRTQAERLVAAVQAATGERVELAYIDQGYTGNSRPPLRPPTASASR